MKPHGPIVGKHHEQMNVLAKALDELFNGRGGPRQIGFALLVYNLGEDIKGTGRINYIGNGQREDVLIALKELVARWEGRYVEPETAQ